jgi:hypothetical protein
MQVKVYGSLILTQSLMMHKRMDYGKVWTDFEFKLLLDAVITIVLFVVALLHLTRLN